MMEMAAYFLMTVLLLYITAKVFTWPFKMLGKLLINSLIGVILLVAINLIGNNFGMTLGINVFTVLISGFCGIPGVAFLIIFKKFL